MAAKKPPKRRRKTTSAQVRKLVTDEILDLVELCNAKVRSDPDEAPNWARIKISALRVLHDRNPEIAEQVDSPDVIEIVAMVHGEAGKVVPLKPKA